MDEAPIMSTIVAIGLLPIAILYVHAYLSGIKKWRFHKISGLLALSGDLIVSIGYMIYRTLGGKAGGSSIDLSGGILAYFIVHGIISVFVIILEIAAIATGALAMRHKSIAIFHKKITKVLFPIWWLAFLSGEFIYLKYYIL